MPAIETKTVLRYGTSADRLVQRRRRIIRSLIFLIAASLALALSIMVMGDMRHYRVAMNAGRTYIDQVSQRVGQQRQLPLNLRFDESVDDDATVFIRNFEWLTRDQAYLLRRTKRRVIAAHSSPVRRWLLVDGRVVVFFQDGEFSLEWLSLPGFEAVWQTQSDEIGRLDRELREEDSNVADEPGRP